MSVHEIVVKLAEVLAASDEYKGFIAAKENLRKNKTNGDLLDDFRQRHFELQMAELAGQEIDDEVKEQMEQDYQLLCLDPDINEYLNAEYRFSLILEDIQGTIAESVPEWFDFSGNHHLIN